MQLFDVTKIDADWDVTDEDDVDTDANRAAFPDAFRWLCCDASGARPGCRRGRHEANPELSLKGRGATASQESSLERDPLRLDEEGFPYVEDDDLSEEGEEPDHDDDEASSLPQPRRGRLGDRPLERRSASREEASALREGRRRWEGDGRNGWMKT